MGATSTKKFVTLEQAEQNYGVPVGTLRKMIGDKRLTAYKPTRRVLVSVEEIERLIAASAESKPETHADAESA